MNMVSIGVNEVGAGVVAGDVDGAVGGGGEAAGERGEVGESQRERVFEERE